MRAAYQQVRQLNDVEEKITFSAQNFAIDLTRRMKVHLLTALKSSTREKKNHFTIV